MVDKSRSRAQNGVRLGLSICMSIIRAHEGDLKIVSKPEEGTTVCIYFPFEDYLHVKRAQGALFKGME